MATPKYRGIKLGPGNINDQVEESEVFVEPLAPVDNVDGKDGDVWIQVPSGGGAGGADIYIRSNGVWRAATNANPAIVALNDAQLTSDTALEYPHTSLRYAAIDYTLKRGVGDSRRRSGTLVVLNDGTTIDFSNEFEEIGADVGVTFTTDISGSLARVRYTSVDEGGTPIELRYAISGWS